MKATTMTATKRAEKSTAKMDFAEKVSRALVLQDTIKRMKTELDDIKEFFHQHFEMNKTMEKVVTSEGVAILKKTNSYSVAPEKVEVLKQIFGQTYPVMVTEKTSFGVSAAMKKLLTDADYEHSKTIRDAVIIKITPSVEFQGLNA